MGEGEGFDIEKLSRAIANELKKLNEIEKPPVSATPGDMEKNKEVPTWNCPECGEPLKGGEKHCPGCGVELEWEP